MNRLKQDRMQMNQLKHKETQMNRLNQKEAQPKPQEQQARRSSIELAYFVFLFSSFF